MSEPPRPNRAGLPGACQGECGEESRVAGAAAEGAAERGAHARRVGGLDAGQGGRPRDARRACLPGIDRVGRTVGGGEPAEDRADAGQSGRPSGALCAGLSSSTRQRSLEVSDGGAAQSCIPHPGSLLISPSVMLACPARTMLGVGHLVWGARHDSAPSLFVGGLSRESGVPVWWKTQGPCELSIDCGAEESVWPQGWPLEEPRAGPNRCVAASGQTWATGSQIVKIRRQQGNGLAEGAACYAEVVARTYATRSARCTGSGWRSTTRSCRG